MKRLLYSVLFLCSSHLIADTGHVPHEVESQGGHSLGLNNGGSVSSNGLGAIRANPAMLAAERKYELNGSYVWPGAGREIYQVGAVDSKTAAIAMGLMYTSHREGHKHWRDVSGRKQESAFYDSSLKRRIALGLAYNFSGFSVGINGEFVDGIKDNRKGSSGVTLGFGAVYAPFSGLRLGASVENLVNGKVKEFAPRTYRVGASYKLWNVLDFNVDYVQRERVPQERPYKNYQSVEAKKLLAEEEKTAVFSASYFFQNLLLFSAGYGHSFDSSQRKSAAGSLSVVRNNFYLGYALRRPYFSKDNFTHTLQASYHVNL